MRSSLFVSYARKDDKVLEEFKPFFETLERDSKLKIWHDGRIDAGDLWRDEIEGALKDARLALLLVSQDFLASPFIARQELLPLLAAAERDELRIFWLPVGPSLYQKTAIVRYQSLINPEKPLSAYRGGKRTAVIKDVCERISAILDAPLASQSAQPAPSARPAVGRPAPGGAVRTPSSSLPADFAEPLWKRYMNLSGRQRELLSLVAKLSLRSRDGLSVPTRALHERYRSWSAGELYYRLEQLRLLGFVDRVGDSSAPESRQSFKLSDACHDEISMLLVKPAASVVKPDPKDPRFDSGAVRAAGRRPRPPARPRR